MIRALRKIALKEGGFTLIELLVVLSIISILVVAFGVEFVGWREKYTSEADTKKIFTALMDAKLNSLKEKRYFFINMPASDPHLLRIYKDTAPAPYGDAKLVLTGGDPDQQFGPDIRLDNAIHIMNEYREFWFTPQGHLRHKKMNVVNMRDFQIRLASDSSTEKLPDGSIVLAFAITAQGDYNCLLVTPTLYFAGGIWNATEDEEKGYSGPSSTNPYHKLTWTTSSEQLCIVK